MDNMSDKLRNYEMYQMQETFDRLYADSKNNDNFYKLIEIISSQNNIRLAYRSIKTNTGSSTPGHDKTTIKTLEKVSEDELINTIQRKLRNYSPRKVRRVLIPKENGEMRPLGIPSIWDRVIQQCILQVLEPIMEAKFYKHSYGFRPNRSAQHALSRVVSLINRGKMYYVVNIDIQSFFDNINHSKLKKQLWHLGIRDKKLLVIINKMLKAEIVGEGIQKKGTPQGGILLPLLSNIVLNELDHWVSSQWENIPINGKNIHNFHNSSAKKTNLKSGYIVRYADDFKIMCRSYDHAVRFYHAVTDFLKHRLGLNVNKQKSSIVNIKKKSVEFLGFKIKAIKKESARNGYIAQTNISDKSKERIKNDLRKAIKDIQYNSYNKKISVKYNQLVMGVKNYYRYATHVYLDLDRIGMSISKMLKIRLKSRGSYESYDIQEKNYKEQNVGLKNQTKIFRIGNHTSLHVINAVHHKNPMNFRQELTPYTKKGRRLMQKKSVGINNRYLQYILEHMDYSFTGYRGEETNVKYLDNRLSRYLNQKGCCAILKQSYHPSEMACHHIIPKKYQGTDEYNNLVWLHNECHKLVHAVETSTINSLIDSLNLNNKQIKRINSFREKCNNKHIAITL